MGDLCPKEKRILPFKQGTRLCKLRIMEKQTPKLKVMRVLAFDKTDMESSNESLWPWTRQMWNLSSKRDKHACTD
jgi:hypothetical protein